MQRRGGHADLHRDGQRNAGTVGPTEFLAEHQGGRVGALAAVRRVVLKPKGAQLGELGEQFVRGEDASCLPLVAVGVDLAFDEVADRGAEGVMFFRELHQDSSSCRVAGGVVASVVNVRDGGSSRPSDRSHSAVRVGWTSSAA